MPESNNSPSIIGLVPARTGSKRVPGKNIRRLAGHPLMAYTLAAAAESGIFADIVVSTDSDEYAAIARHYGAEVPFLRPAELAGDLSPDVEWVDYTLRRLRELARHYDAFSLLRVTSPFRQAETIDRAWRQFLETPGADSLRAVEKCKQHPGKMWVRHGRYMAPLLPFHTPQQPWHSSPYQVLPEVYAQNASLEIAWTRVVLEGGTIAGDAVVPFFTVEYEGFDLNNSLDWAVAETLLGQGDARLPVVKKAPYSTVEDQRRDTHAAKTNDRAND
jgi:CMP-N,N'-diacetyllegionaminic acid synthase